MNFNVVHADIHAMIRRICEVDMNDNQEQNEREDKEPSRQEKQIYVITGGPCTGKTTILNDLHEKGYRVLHEIARKVIEEKQKTNKDYLPTTDINEFQQLLLDAQRT